SSGSVERNLQQHGRILQAAIEYSCDQATLQNIPYGVKFANNAYTFAQLVNQQWLDVLTNDIILGKVFTDGSSLSLEIDGQLIVLTKELADIPQILCDSTGQITNFSLLLADAGDKHFYQLQAINFWQIEGQWLDAQ
ncbi:hypothetical protein MNBD_GAMMA01-95, partial [hydrothermal vent metagenome]